jgi:two-component system OmpR family response regulator
MSDIKLLYVDDEEDIREVAEFALEDEGFELQLCASGQEALSQIPVFQPDLILLDVMMPGLDGPDTLKQLRQLDGFAHTPVIFFTAKVQAHEIEKFKALGAIDVMAKPFDAMRLAEQIRAIWERVNA